MCLQVNDSESYAQTVHRVMNPIVTVLYGILLYCISLSRCGLGHKLHWVRRSRLVFKIHRLYTASWIRRKHSDRPSSNLSQDWPCMMNVDVSGSSIFGFIMDSHSAVVNPERGCPMSIFSVVYLLQNSRGLTPLAVGAYTCRSLCFWSCGYKCLPDCNIDIT